MADRDVAKSVQLARTAHAWAEDLELETGVGGNAPLVGLLRDAADMLEDQAETITDLRGELADALLETAAIRETAVLAPVTFSDWWVDLIRRFGTPR